ncbi:MAG: DedA family protein [Gemmatimonadota bacterium]
MSRVAAFIYAYGYPGIFSLLMLGIVGLPVPDEWMLIFAGYLVYKGHFQFLPAFATAALGSICGISVSYALGRTLGAMAVRRYGRWFRVTEEKLGRVQAWFDRVGHWSLAVGYFVPGIRHLAGFVAGTSKFRFRGFALFAYSGALAWSATFIAVGFVLGKEWAETGRAVHRDVVIGTVSAAVAIMAWLFLSRRPKRSPRRGPPLTG